MWQVIAGLLGKNNEMTQQQNAMMANRDNENIMNARVEQQAAQMNTMQGMDAARQQAFQRQQSFFDNLMNKYKLGRV